MDDNDRQSFLDRLATILEETQTQCYAWTLIPDHFHLLLQIGPTPLSKVMSRLMTGYAVSFNKRHRRSGHLFQNRYKSVVCEENPYLLELIRYIHLNPLREKLVKDLRELDRYQWCGHSTILGKRNVTAEAVGEAGSMPLIPRSLAEKTTQDILLHFGNKPREARRRYRQFLKKGINQGARPDLQGGGLVRSAGGDKTGLLGRKKGERESGDERILGSGDFVDVALKKAGELL
jgi:REP element-mobilizing transposase RayT